MSDEATPARGTPPDDSRPVPPPGMIRTTVTDLSDATGNAEVDARRLEDGTVALRITIRRGVQVTFSDDVDVLRFLFDDARQALASMDDDGEPL